jgi:methylated-DNA-[protein]-cysteine S-methyltransferase
VEILVMERQARYLWTPTPLGRLLLMARDEHLCGAWFDDQRYSPLIDAAWREERDDSLLKEAARQLDGYFSGARNGFDLPLEPAGTPFQKRVWQAIAAIPYGETISYAALAVHAGRPHAVRAAGAATGRNPLSIVVPCHRVVGSNGKLTGYAGGLERKQALLGLEGRQAPLFRRVA